MRFEFLPVGYQLHLTRCLRTLRAWLQSTSGGRARRARRALVRASYQPTNKIKTCLTLLGPAHAAKRQPSGAWLRSLYLFCCPLGRLTLIRSEFKIDLKSREGAKRAQEKGIITWAQVA